MDLQEIVDNFELLEDWEDRYRYLIELGHELEPLAVEEHTNENKVRGCASQVWLKTSVSTNAQHEPFISLRGDSDAHIVRGLITLILTIYSEKPATTILATDAEPIFDRLGLAQHLTPQRANGVRSMIDRIKSDARGALAK